MRAVYFSCKFTPPKKIEKSLPRSSHFGLLLLCRSLPPFYIQKMSYSSKTLHDLRNLIPVDDVVKNILNMDFKYIEGHLRFICPDCFDRHTSTNLKSNLARCFRCQVNYNPIELYMKVHQTDFKHSVNVLSLMLPFYKEQRRC